MTSTRGSDYKVMPGESVVRHDSSVRMTLVVRKLKWTRDRAKNKQLKMKK